MDEIFKPVSTLNNNILPNNFKQFLKFPIYESLNTLFYKQQFYKQNWKKIGNWKKNQANAKQMLRKNQANTEFLPFENY